MKSVRHGFRILFVVLIVSIDSAAYGLGLQVGVGSGILFVENPGSVYTAPSTASATVRFSQESWYAETRLLSAPFLATKEAFQDSFMLLPELSLGGAVGVATRPHGTWHLAVSLDGGGYLRDPGTSDGEAARRPVVGGTVRTGFETGAGWQYEFSLRYRAFLDEEPVHSVEPSLTILYRLTGRGSEAE
ncbi:MAG: hypothetical protein ACOC25_03245 [Alkalispirochaetaceae bacterium]